MEISIDDLQAILKIFRDSDLEQMYIEIGDLKFEISKAGGVISSAPVRKAQRSAGPSPAPLQLEQQGEAEVPATVQPAVSRLGERTGLIAIDAPTLGVFCRRPAPDQEPFVQIGGAVRTGDPVCIIEVMKLFHRVESHHSGRIVEICVEDGAKVEVGQTPMSMKSDAP